MKAPIRIIRTIVCAAAVQMVACQSGSGPEEPSAALGAPSGVSAEAGDGLVAVSWHPVQGATSYSVYYDTGAAVTKASAHVSAGDTSADITRLTNGVRYTLAVSASDGSRESDLSAVVTATPVQPPQPLPTASPQSQGIDSARLEEAIAFLGLQTGEDSMRQVVVMRHGYIIKQGPAADSVHHVWSVTKSLCSIVLGLLIGEGRCSLSTRAADYVPALAADANYARLELRHFVTLTSGYQPASEDQPFVPGPSRFPPGASFHYGTEMNLLALVLTKIAGEPLESYFTRMLADRIGMDNGAWHWGNWGTVDGLTVNGGAGTSAKGVYLSALEAARLGQLLLRKGMWNGTALLSAAWIDSATSVRVPNSLPCDTMTSPLCLAGCYGFNFWVKGIPAGETRPNWSYAPPGTFLMQGYLFNVVIVIPAWDIVFVRLGHDKELDDYSTTLDGFFRLLGQSRLP